MARLLFLFLLLVVATAAQEQTAEQRAQAAVRGLLELRPASKRPVSQSQDPPEAPWLADLAAKLDSLPPDQLPETVLSSDEQERLWKEIQTAPHYLDLLAPLLPGRPEVFDWVIAQLPRAADPPVWLLARDPRRRAQLIRAAEKGDSQALEALSKVDWKTARPLLDRLLQGDSKLTALSILLERPETEEVARKALIQVAAGPSEEQSDRDYAVSLLLTDGWQGRDEYFESLFLDPVWSSIEFSESPLREFAASDPGRWLPRMREFLADPRPAVHNNAADVLLGFEQEPHREQALRLLLPWLSDPDWAQTGDPRLQGESSLGRLRVIQGLKETRIAEAVPALLHILRHSRDDAEIAYTAETLQAYASPEFPGAWSEGLTHVKEGIYVTMMVRTGLSSDQFTTEQQVDAVLRLMEDLQGLEREDKMNLVSPMGPLPVSRALGLELLGRQPSDPVRASLVATALAWSEAGRQELASLENALLSMEGSDIGAYFLSRLSDGHISAERLGELLVRAPELRQSNPVKLKEMAEGEGTVAAIASVILSWNDRTTKLMQNGSDAQKMAVVSCSRFLGDSLDLGQLERLAASQDLRPAVLAYLEVAHDPAARALIGRLQDGFAITGRSSSVEAFQKAEDRILADFLARPELTEVLALQVYSIGYTSRIERVEVRVQGDVAELITREIREVLPEQNQPLAPDVYHRRSLTNEELHELREFVQSQGVDTWDEWSNVVSHHPTYTQYLHLTREGGRRVAASFNAGADNGPGAKYVHLRRLFGNLAEVPASPVYPALAGIPGARIAEEHANADLITGDNQGLAIKVYREEEGWHWRSLTKTGGIDQPVAAPSFEVALSELDRIGNMGAAVLPDGAAVVASFDAVQVRSKNGKMRPLLEGLYAHPVAGAEGRVLLSHAPGQSWADPNVLKLLDPQTGTLRDVELPAAETLDALAYLSSRGAFLAQRTEGEVGQVPSQFYLVDPKTGAAQEVEGELQPWTTAGQRPLQKAGDGLYWAALPSESGTQVGVIDERTFRFEPRASYPRLYFESPRMWVQDDQVYAVGEDVLILPLQTRR